MERIMQCYTYDKNDLMIRQLFEKEKYWKYNTTSDSDKLNRTTLIFMNIGIMIN